MERWLAALVVSASLSLTPAPAFAQDPIRPSPQQQGPANAPSAPGTGGVTGNLGPAEPRFQVRLKHFTVFDETGWDLLGSDEAIIVVITQRYAMSTEEFGSLDSNGEVETFAQDANCVIPATDSPPADEKWACDPAGAAAPITFRLQAFEQDGGFCAPNLAFSDLAASSEDVCGPDDSGGNIIGDKTVTLDLPALMAKLPNVGATFEDTAELKGGCYAPVCGEDEDAPHYQVTYTVTRVADAAGSGGLVVEH
jgi:hypothetical protein